MSDDDVRDLARKFAKDNAENLRLVSREAEMHRDMLKEFATGRPLKGAILDEHGFDPFGDPHPALKDKTPPYARFAIPPPCKHPYLVSVTTDLNTGADIGLCGECREWSQIGGEPFTDALNHPPRRGLWQRLVAWVAK